jgi:uncharacterized protein (DUF1778 family)
VRRYSTNLNIRLRPGEKKRIDAAAKACGVPLSWWIRELLMSAAEDAMKTKAKAMPGYKRLRTNYPVKRDKKR